MENAGWIDYSDPRPELDRPVNSWVFRLPAGRERRDEYWIELSGIDVHGNPVSIRLADGGAFRDEATHRVVNVTVREFGKPDRTDRFVIDVAEFEAGEPPATFLSFPDGPAPPEWREVAYQFWHGLPRSAPYAAAAERYLRLPLRTDAFHCIQAYAQVVVRDEETGDATRFRRDAWFCEEIPFGVAQIETQVIDAQHQVIARQRMTMTAAGALK
jgi:hypothetical protein